MSEPKPCLVGRTTAELAELLAPRSDAKWRAKQLATWIYKKAETDFDAMRDLPKDLREELAAKFVVNPLSVARHARSTDDVDKLLVHNGDGQVYECVLLPYDERVSCCISSQVGCPMGCAFCATGLGGFDRNLDVSEIVGQYLLLQRVRQANMGVRDTGALPPQPLPLASEREGHVDPSPPSSLRSQAPSPQSRGGQSTLQAGQERISRIVFMGMGEPLLNLKNVLKALQIFHGEIGLSYRHITISTVGLVPQIKELAKLDLPIHLALSLHSPFDKIRDTLMPVNKRWPVAEVVQAMKDYQKATGRKITLEYLLIGELTDSLDQAAEIAKLIKGTPSVVNLIPFNYVATKEGFKRPSRQSVRAFKAELRKRGVNVTERIERGHDIAAACGQLAGQHTGRFARKESISELSVRS